MTSNDTVAKSEEPDLKRKIKSAVASAVEDALGEVDIEADVRAELDRADVSDQVRPCVRVRDVVQDAEERIAELIDTMAIVDDVLENVDYDDNADDEDIEREADLAAGQAVDEVVAGSDAREVRPSRRRSRTQPCGWGSSGNHRAPDEGRLAQRALIFVA